MRKCSCPRVWERERDLFSAPAFGTLQAVCVGNSESQLPSGDNQPLPPGDQSPGNTARSRQATARGTVVWGMLGYLWRGRRAPQPPHWFTTLFAPRFTGLCFLLPPDSCVLQDPSLQRATPMTPESCWLWICRAATGQVRALSATCTYLWVEGRFVAGGAATGLLFLLLFI